MLCVFVEVRTNLLYIFPNNFSLFNSEEAETDRSVIGVLSVTDKQYGALVERNSHMRSERQSV
jgi:hypothetical protein